MIPHRNPSFLIDKSSPKQIKIPRLMVGGLYLGAVLCRRGDAALRRCSPPPPESQRAGEPISPTASVKSSGAALFAACGPAMSCPARQFLPGVRPPPLCPPGTSHHAKRPRTMAGSFSIPAGAGSAALLQAVDGKGIEPEALIKPESCLIAIGHTEFPGAALLRSARRVLPATQKDPAQRRGLFLFRQEPDQLRFCRQSMVKG